MTKISSFEKVIQQYDAIFFDAFGVLKNYNGLIEGVAETIYKLHNDQKQIFILTNDSSRSPFELAKRYQQQGIDLITEENMISSGMLAREYLQLKIKKGTIAYLGTKNSAHYVENLGLPTVPISEVQSENFSDISALVLLDEEGFNWESDLSKSINLLRHKNIPVVVANTDRTYPVSNNQINIAIGGIANMLEDIVGKRFIRFGKPDVPLFIYAYEKLSAIKSIPKDKILMVGDTLHTDILGGNKFGIHTALVLSGNTLPDQYHFLINSSGIIPDYVCHSVAL
ncbi:MAG: TIGR01459 family HAD-type hydrolase [Haliscomenobacter sp.]|nr:TIGR01459 family HAD-type hydrolase [Haliscomenobacter sp.]